MTSLVEYESSSGVAMITLNRPQRLNALNRDLLDALLTAAEDALSNEEIRVLVLTGAGKGFCAGGDMKGFSSGALVEDGSYLTQVGVLRSQMRLVELLRNSHAVTIAAVNGACAGAGLSIACACDIRIASDTAVFRSAFIDAGLSGDFGGTWTLAEIVGAARAKEMYFLNGRYSAREAEELGLVSRVIDVARFRDEVSAIAEELAAKAPLALRRMKENFVDSSQLPYAEAANREAQRHIACCRTTDALEAAQAFIEKREPEFTGS